MKFEETVTYELNTDELHDVIADLVEIGNPVLQDKYLIELFRSLPDSIKHIAYAWGSGDTEFRDAMHKYYSNRLNLVDAKRLDIMIEVRKVTSNA